MQKIKVQAKRNVPTGAKEKIQEMEAVIIGWVNYFIPNFALEVKSKFCG
jgi:hypothetical protein